jgi:hypothetical protein
MTKGARRSRGAGLPAGAAVRAVLVGLVFAAASVQAVAQSVGQDLPRTYAERAGWERLTPHDEVVAFVHEIAARSPDARLAEIGRSREGRPLLLLTLARPAVSQPWEAALGGRPVVFIGAQVHGDEQAGKEGLLLFARDLAFGALSPLLDEVVFLLVPQINPDGGEAGTWGTRANRAGYNVNRDYLRLVNPESRAVVERVIVPWRPDIVIDAHELTGPRSYDFYTLFPTQLNAPAAVVEFAAGPLTDAVRRAIEAAGFTWFPYHLQPSDPTRVAEEGISSGEYGGRALRGYGGVQGSVTLLFESRRERDARAGLEPRARMQRIAMEAVGRFAAEQADALRRAVADGMDEMRRRARADGDSIVVTAEFVVRGTVPYRMPDVRRGADGQWHETGRIRELRVPVRDSAVATLVRARPAAYVIEAHRSDLAAHLRMHGVSVERLLEPVVLRVESFRVDSVRVAVEPYEGYLPRTVWTTPTEGEVRVAAGSWLVRTDQRAAALIFTLFEPEDIDSWATTGLFIAEEQVGRPLPVHRLRAVPGVIRRLEH